MRTIKIGFVDFWPDFDYKKFFMYNYLSKYYHLIISDEPDYLFCSSFGYKHWKYSNCIKIYYTAENLIPDFNIYDYGIGFYYLSLEDRYLRFPLWLIYSWNELNNMEDKNIDKELCERMVGGDISIIPCKNKNGTSCDFCSYASICQFDVSIKGNTYTVLNDKSDEEVIKLMKESDHNSYPVVENNKLVGMVTSFDIVVKDWADHVSEIMSTKLVVANENLSINDASRVMFRRGISRMPVINENGEIVGIITNTDMVRSHIERSTPNKVDYFKSTMDQLYGIKSTLKHMQVDTDKIRPTQDRVYADELEGRTYELKMGLAEPAIVVKTGDRWILVDGHHRTVAAKQLGCKTIDAYVIDLGKDIRLGLEKTADKAGIKTFNDIEIIDDDKHPLIAITESIQDNEKSD